MRATTFYYVVFTTFFARVRDKKFAVTCYALNARVALQRKSDRGCVIVPATNYISRRRRLDDVLKYRASAKLLDHMIPVY